MGLELWSWEVPEQDLASLLDQLLPSGGFVAAGRAERAVLAAAGGLGSPPAGWQWGRAFDPDREVVWRREGGLAHVTLAGTVPGELPTGGVPHDRAGGWRRLEDVRHEDRVDAVERPQSLLLWHKDDLRLPCSPNMPGDQPLAIAVEEWFDDDGLAWCRYLTVGEASNG